MWTAYDGPLSTRVSRGTAPRLIPEADVRCRSRRTTVAHGADPVVKRPAGLLDLPAMDQCPLPQHLDGVRQGMAKFC